MTSVQVMCIRKRNHNDPHHRIEGIGGFHGGKQWYLPEDDAIRDIENGTYSFYTVSPNGVRANVKVAMSSSGRKYLKTDADTLLTNNLLYLPECPR